MTLLSKRQREVGRDRQLTPTRSVQQPGIRVPERGSGSGCRYFTCLQRRDAGAGSQGAPSAPTAPSPSRSVGQGTCLGEEQRRGKFGPEMVAVPPVPRFETPGDGNAGQRTSRADCGEANICLRRWKAVGTSLCASKDPPFQMKFRSPSADKIYDDEIH